jgi:chromosome segregation ATPase
VFEARRFMTERMLTGQELAGPQVRAMLEKQAEIRPSYRAQSYAKYVRWAQAEGQALRERFSREWENYQKLLQDLSKTAEDYQAADAAVKAKAAEVEALISRYNSLASTHNSLYSELQRMYSSLLAKAEENQRIRQKYVDQYSEWIARESQKSGGRFTIRFTADENFRQFMEKLNQRLEAEYNQLLDAYNRYYNQRYAPVLTALEETRAALNRASTEVYRLAGLRDSLLSRYQALDRAREEAEARLSALRSRYESMSRFWRW